MDILKRKIIMKVKCSTDSCIIMEICIIVVEMLIPNHRYLHKLYLQFIDCKCIPIQFTSYIFSGLMSAPKDWLLLSRGKKVNQELKSSNLSRGKNTNKHVFLYQHSISSNSTGWTQILKFWNKYFKISFIF